MRENQYDFLPGFLTNTFLSFSLECIFRKKRQIDIFHWHVLSLVRDEIWVEIENLYRTHATSIAFTPFLKTIFLFSRWVFFRKFFPCVWLAFKSELWWSAYGTWLMIYYTSFLFVFKISKKSSDILFAKVCKNYLQILSKQCILYPTSLMALVM